MPLPPAKQAQPFYRAALQRFEDGRFLEGVGRTTAAVYLAGYGVECILKALIVNATPSKKREEAVQSFRGRRAHDFEWLKELYSKAGGPPFPKSIQRQFTIVNTWSTDFRYQTGVVEQRDADAFLAAAESIITWADGRL
jgi:hypothetical protein